MPRDKGAIGRFIRDLSFEDKHRAMALLARRDINAFAWYVFGYDNMLFHREWHRLADTHPRLIIHAPIEHGKSEQFTILRTLWLIGRNPNIRIAIISAAAEAQARKFLRVIRKVIEENDRYHAVFPEVRPQRPWSQSALMVARERESKDYTVHLVGIRGHLGGSRLDLIILDDVLCFENTFTAHQRQKVLGWLENDVLTRLVDGGRLIAIGTAWHRMDAYFMLAHRQGFTHRLYRAYLPDGTPLWPKTNASDEHGWSVERLEAKKAELGSLAFARQLLNDPRDDETARCKEEWLENCVIPSLVLGRRPLEHEPLCVTGVDLGVGLDRRSDLTAIATVAYNRKTQSKRLVDILSGRWSAAQIADHVIRTANRYGSVIVIENNGAQDFLRQYIQEKAPRLAIKAHHTGSNKQHEIFGVESVFSDFEQGLWIVPSPKNNQEVAALFAECLDYDPASHTGDRLMALWIAREYLRKMLGKGNVVVSAEAVLVPKGDLSHET